MKPISTYSSEPFSLPAGDGIRQTRIGPACVLLPAIMLVLMLFSNAPGQQAQRSMDRDTLRTGDLFQYHVFISEVDRYDEVIYPDSAAFGEDFEIHERRVEEQPTGDSLSYTLRFYGVDAEQVPELYVGLRDGTDTTYVVVPATSFTYQSRVADEATELRPLKPIFPFFRSLWPYILAGLLIALITVFLLYFYRDRLFPQKKISQTPSPPPEEPFHDPVEQLRITIDKLRADYPEPAKQPKAFFTQLGDAFRSYYENTHDFPALESTTREVIHNLKARRFDEEIIQLTSSILQEADLVKFARYQPNESQCTDVIRQAEQLTGRIAISDRKRVEELRKLHEEKQKQQLDDRPL